MVTMTQAELMGERVRRLREARGWSQGMLSAYANVPRTWLSNIETERSRKPRADYLDRVSQTLGVSTAYLLTGAGTSDNGITITGPEELASRLRRNATYPPEYVARFEKWMADFFDLHDKPAGDQPQREGDDQPGGDGPDAAAGPKR